MPRVEAGFHGPHQHVFHAPPVALGTIAAGHRWVLLPPCSGYLVQVVIDSEAQRRVRPVELEVEDVRIAGEDGEELPLSSSHVLRVPRLPEFTGGSRELPKPSVGRYWLFLRRRQS